MARQVVAL
ncbi:hypothetical protein ECPA4_4831, partial [Escherichia coli PA4]